MYYHSNSRTLKRIHHLYLRRNLSRVFIGIVILNISENCQESVRNKNIFLWSHKPKGRFTLSRHPNSSNLPNLSFCALYKQTSQLGRIAYREILIIIAFRIPTFQEVTSKLLLFTKFGRITRIQLPNLFFPGFCSHNKNKLLADGCSRIFTLHYSSI